MELLYVRGKSDRSELVMTVLVPVLMGSLAFLIIKNSFDLGLYLPRLKMPFADVIFGVLWAVSLILMGMASYRAKLAAPASVSHVYYAAQLLLAFIWSIVLFRFGVLNIAFIIMILYLFFASATFFEFDKADKISGRLMLPSILWGIVLAGLSFYTVYV